ncbi:MAG: YbgA family protein [Bacteroidales bacterium]
MEAFPKPKLLVSRCLGFDNCRYDGGIISETFIKELSPYVEFITVCPETEIGLGVPREPVRLVVQNNRKYIFQPATGLDVTGKMERFTEDYLNNLEEVDGFIMKHKSPSCGLGSVKIFAELEGKKEHSRGPGFFGESIMSKFEALPVEDEGRLRNFSIREHFLTRIFTIAAFREFKKQPTMNGLVNFHSNNKMLFMAYNQKVMRELGKITANHNDLNTEDVVNQYEALMLQLLKAVPRFTSWINMIQHAFGFISDDMKPEEKKFFLNAIEEYRDERVPLSVLIKLLNSYALRFRQEYLLRQSFLNPFPLNLVDITDSGKGRNR